MTWWWQERQGISGTLELICREWDKLRTYFSESFLRMGVETLKLYDFRRRCILERSWVFYIVFYRERWNFKWSVEKWQKLLELVWM